CRLWKRSVDLGSVGPVVADVPRDGDRARRPARGRTGHRVGFHMGSALGLTSLARRVDVGLSGVKPVVAEAIGLLVTFVATTAAALAVLAVAAHAVPGWSSTIVSSGSM